MTNATVALIDELSEIIDKNKYMVLSGATGVGKTFLASAIAENCLKAKYNAQGSLPQGEDHYEMVMEFVPIHPSFSYEDFVSGISIRTEDGNVLFKQEDKLFLSFLKKANGSANGKKMSNLFSKPAF